MGRSCRVVTALFVLVSSVAFAQDGGLTLPSHHDDPVTVSFTEVAAGLPEQRLQVFIGVETACCHGKSPMAGHYQSESETVSFTPMFPFLLGQPYTVRSYSGSGAMRLTEFTLQPKATPVQPSVVAIGPSGPSLPENTLRFYIDFATPMQPHRAEDFIDLINANGVVDAAAFMTFKQELWNEDRTRLTLLMDPGRIKRGVAQNQELGSVLEQGLSYAIRVKEGWPGAINGQTQDAFEMRFDVGPPLRTRPDPGAWTVTAPRSNSFDPLVLEFDRPFDRVQLGHSIAIRSSDGRRIDGAADILDRDMAWRFAPTERWGKGPVSVVIDARLEDVAGNNFREVLDHAQDSETLDLDRVVLVVALDP